MRYIIYKLIQPEHLKVIEPDGYYQKVTHRTVLEKVDEYGVQSEHETFQGAVDEITAKKDKLTPYIMTVLPIIEIGWDGEIFK